MDHACANFCLFCLVHQEMVDWRAEYLSNLQSSRVAARGISSIEVKYLQ